ncbi:MAG: alpha/beta fold hydrolase [Steroidobacteraceae bacterium]
MDESGLASATLGRLAVDGDEVQTYAWGAPGAPTVLLLHGWGSHAPRWSGFVEAILAQGWRAIAFDAPAHGRSGGKTSNLLRFRAALTAAVARLGPVDAVIAHSFGALTVASSLADAAPLPVRAAVLVSTPADAAYLLDLYLDLVDANPRVRTSVYRLFERRFAAHPAAFSALAGAARVETPVLLIHDRDDEAVPAEHSTALSQRFPAASLRLTSGLGHNRLLRDAGTIAATIDFLRPLLARRTG